MDTAMLLYTHTCGIDVISANNLEKLGNDKFESFCMALGQGWRGLTGQMFIGFRG